MQKIIIKHLKGSKANQTEMFELPFTELVLGRDSAANIKFDPEKDDLVGRSHAKIIHEGDHFKLADLNSRNGTFVNGKRIQDPVVLNVGDLVKLGEAGVEFSFDMDPRPENTVKATRFEQSTASATREQAQPTRATAQESPAAKPSIGRATVERLITETSSQTRKKMINIASGIIAVIVLGAGFLLYQSNKGQEVLAVALNQQKTENDKIIGELEQKLPDGVSASEIAEKYSNSTVSIENSWKLFDITSGEQLFHIYACIKLDKKNSPQPVRCKNENEAYPLYVNNGYEVEPMLYTRGEIHNAEVIYKPIGSSGRMGSGFVVTKDGFILTNRHVAAGWQTKYFLPLPGYILEECPYSGCDFKKFVSFDSTDSKKAKSLEKWIPYNTKTRGGIPTKGKFIEGRNDFLDVTFPNTRIRIPATLVRASDIADVALIKIEIPEQITPVIINSSVTVQAGEEVTITGYPANSPDVDVRVKSQDPMNRSNEWRVLPVPTISTGTVGKIISGNVQMLDDTPSEYRSTFGDVYQLNVNTTGAGNSGGPVFNNAGNVIGLYTYGGEDNSFAVPIKYGEELMGIKAVK